MNKFSSKQIVLFLSFILTILVFITRFVVPPLDLSLFFNIIVVSLFFLVTFFLVQYILNKFILEKIKPIYKIINYIPQKGKEVKRKVSQNFVELSEVEHDVEVWAQDKLQEIERLKDLERYRKDFVGNVSHELKTPIFNIQGYILTLMEGGLEDPKINKLYLNRSEKSIDRMISIVEDLESITKLETGELKTHFTTFDIVKVVEDVFEMEQLLSKERKISLQFANKLDKPIWLNADKKRIIEVLSNLIVNGIKYGKRKGYIKVGFYDFDDKIMVEVSDNGIGIDKKSLPRIFERFYRVDKSRSREQGGTGLGLSIVKHIIEAHGQTINVQSVLDVGTTFTFTLEKAK
ncbi:MAG: sensor histidine kinase [Prolixibacteraceae bacterium]|jgi:two-component system, OmpR family, phosphate regulon sensor histidine kinase PhoR|nr:sensor histidine kinase [Prolixibacteraceae bacterium]MBT6006005.1 sensor histidine kinase [Prolixibacteraceae bacterium]MBT6762927.1 sensor histidine kinase [Prolixibacteraceae bacterium]MBT7000600.1 sensor histidine kinase [Prolixibacteraceae bacterium]MBT7396976.1 sensor histidine kinase [Prolixibacteraceae bacterium]